MNAKGSAAVLWGGTESKKKKEGQGRAFGPAGNGSGLTHKPWVGSGGV